jgi:hypothetical protein
MEISSEIELPGMIEGSGIPDVKIIQGEVDQSLVTGAEVEGPNYLVTGDDVYLWWDDIGKVRISKGELVTVEPASDLESADELNMIPFILGPVMALMLHQRGFLVLHGSAVNIKLGKSSGGIDSAGDEMTSAVAFLGHRGNGKSTTAIHLYVAGYPLVADDILAIKFSQDGKPVVYPGYPHVRLSDEAYHQVKDRTDILTPIRTLAGKVFCDASHEFSPEPVNLERIYVIEKIPEEEGGSTGISVLKSQENLIDLIRHSVANRIFQHTSQKENLINCSQLVNNIKVKRLEVVHSFENIRDLIQAVEGDWNNL